MFYLLNIANFAILSTIAIHFNFNNYYISTILLHFFYTINEIWLNLTLIQFLETWCTKWTFFACRVNYIYCAKNLIFLLYHIYLMVIKQKYSFFWIWLRKNTNIIVLLHILYVYCKIYIELALNLKNKMLCHIQNAILLLHKTVTFFNIEKCPEIFYKCSDSVIWKLWI